jgi:hypothetical protein
MRMAKRILKNADVELGEIFHQLRNRGSDP